MAVGGQHAQQGLALHGAGKHLLPGGAGGVGGDAAIDGAVTDTVILHVIE